MIEENDYPLKPKDESIRKEQAREETTKILEFLDTAFGSLVKLNRGLLEAGLMESQSFRNRVLSDIGDAIFEWEKGSKPMKSISKRPGVKEDTERAEKTLSSFREYFENIQVDDEDAENPDEFDK